MCMQCFTHLATSVSCFMSWARWAGSVIRGSFAYDTTVSSRGSKGMLCVCVCALYYWAAYEDYSSLTNPGLW